MTAPNGAIDDKYAHTPKNEAEWSAFESKFGIWLKTNSKLLTIEEQRPVKRATFLSVTTGLCTGFLTSKLCESVPLIPKRRNRRLFSAACGIYATAFMLISLRRHVYLELLSSQGPAGEASRRILDESRGLKTVEVVPQVVNVPNPDVIVPPYNNACTVPRIRKSPWSTVSINAGDTQQGKSWDDIRRENEHRQDEFY
ncbi:hypothetical protein BdWA1_000794 [Babesia duncani]|uniref:Uncharacterized protein n=1 Tax=Babesia duncani TaxID=323732 RepID=A0AAD9PGL5_9APIC|nr:hypothetical protein BdWA1_004162 [Babesia duncani]KAK2197791.1 hypothetical protein BdWA1_000794 [Babesia duncani]